MKVLEKNERIGCFNEKGNEYEIWKPDLKRPMLNYFWNKKILSAVNQNGGGNGGYGGMTANYIGEVGKPRAWLLGNGNRYVYIRNDDSRTLWNPGWYPTKTALDEYRCVHGLGYSMIEGVKEQIYVGLYGTVSYDEPAEMWQIKVRNQDVKERKVTVFPFVEFDLEGYVHNSGFESWVYASFDEQNGLIFADNSAEERPYEWFHGFCATDYPIKAFDTSRTEFLGVYGNVTMPKAIEDGGLTNSLASCEKMVGAFELSLNLAAGEEKEILFVVGSANSKAEAQRIAEKLLKKECFAETIKLNQQSKEDLCSLMMIKTPDEKVNAFANYWLKQQVQLCVEVGRGAGNGFRDCLQDCWTIAAFNPKHARDKIYEALGQIYRSGRCVRGWNPLKDRECSDGPTWVAPTVNAYLKETGDTEFLDEKVSYLDGGEDTVWEHILTTTRYSSDDLGPHNLVLAHVGDWNDSLNGMGKGGIGESVWTSIALYQSLNAVAEIAKVIKKDAMIEQEMLERAKRIKNAINEHGWDGEWYLAGYRDDGRPVGSKLNEEGMIYLNSQTWATMLGIADEERKNLCLEAVDKYLDSDYGALTCYPAYTKYDSTVGRLTGFVPGIWENGAPYCHGAAFKVISDFVQGRGDEGYQMLQKILPDSQWNPSTHSGSEPYVLTNMYFGPSNPRKGETLFAWITGTAGWVYRSISEHLLGFQPQYDGFLMNPCIPKEWKRVSGTRKFRGDIYEIEILNENGNSNRVKELIVDGKMHEAGVIGVFGDGRKHKIQVCL